MLTEKCPYCGSFNDANAAECYFCHKDLPDTPGHKKQHKPKKEDKSTVVTPLPGAGIKKKSPPGCLMLFVGALIFACVLTIFEAINAAHPLINWQKIPIPATEAGLYVVYFLQQLIREIDQLLKFPVIVITSVGMLLILSYGLLNMRQWARVLALMLLVILMVANSALFVVYVVNFYFTPITIIGFILILVGIGLNIFTLVWFFEHKKTFDRK
jgi:hypothetical protein